MLHTGIGICKEIISADVKGGLFERRFVPRLLTMLLSQLGSVEFEQVTCDFGSSKFREALERRQAVRDRYNGDLDGVAIRNFECNYATTRMALGLYGEGLEILERLKGPSDFADCREPWVLNNLALCYDGLGRNAEAVRAAGAAVKLLSSTHGAGSYHESE